MAVDYLDLETRREAPMAVIPATPAETSAEQVLAVPVETPARPRRVIDLDEDAPSYWVRRRRQQEAGR